MFVYASLGVDLILKLNLDSNALSASQKEYQFHARYSMRCSFSLQCAKENHDDRKFRNFVECVQYGGTLFWFWSGTQTVWLRQSQPYYAKQTQRYTNQSAHAHSHSDDVFSLLIFFGCHFHLFMLLLSISRAWIRYTSAGSGSLAEQRTSHGARATCKCVSVGKVCSSACVHMSVCESSFQENGTESNRECMSVEQTQWFIIPSAEHS